MKTSQEKRGWQPSRPGPDAGPIYLALADQLSAAIAAGQLRSGDRLPPHRTVAEALGIDLTTVTRAYAEARRRGLVDAAAGRGTFVAGGSAPPPKAEDRWASVVDLSMNLPPHPPAAKLEERLAAGLAALQRRADFRTFLSYRPSAGGFDERDAGAAWLRQRPLEASPDTTLVAPGAQAALMALLTAYIEPGELVAAEALAYPGFRALAAHLRIRVAAVPIDREGLVPDALDKLCRRERPKALYCTPAINNPTTATMSAERGRQIAEVVRRHGLPVFEDDAYGFLPTPATTPLAALAPERTFHISTLAKCIAPGLRLAYLHTPQASHALRLASALRVTAVMASPLTAALAAQWIRDGTAGSIVRAVRAENTARQLIAREILGPFGLVAHAQGNHAWLQLPATWSAAEFVAHMRQHGLAAVPGDAFATEGAAVPNGVRLALGAARDQETLRRTLHIAADVLAQSPAALSQVV